MRILITGAAGFIGKNLTAALEAIRDGKDIRYKDLAIESLYLYDRGTPIQVLEEGCQKADFVFHLAGVNRPKTSEEFAKGNVDFTCKLLDTLKKYGNLCPVMLASSVQACCLGRYDTPYGRSKKAGEDRVFAYGEQTGTKTLVYRFPNVFGKWCRPDYNSAVATFCHHYAHDLPATVTDPNRELELLYIDDLVEELIGALLGREHRCEYDGITPRFCTAGRYCAVPVTHRATLGQITGLLDTFRRQPGPIFMPRFPAGSFEKKLFSAYLSYLPEEKVAASLLTHPDARGSFTELLRPDGCGQVSVSVTKPGITRGRHWHQSKWEIFWVVAGCGLIKMRKLGSKEIWQIPVSGENPQAVYILPGYTHELVNLSPKEDLIAVIWANEPYDLEKPDTFYEEVE